MNATDLPALTGTAKQVAWASDLRASTAADLAATISRYQTTPRAVLIPVWTELSRRILAITDATWWINHRGVDLAIVKAIQTVGRAHFKPGMTPEQQVALLDVDALFAEVTR